MAQLERQPLRSYWAPKYWPTWIGLGLLRLTCLLPFAWQIRLGKAIGAMAHRLAGKRRAITRRNIQLCFPELSEEERDKLALQHFEALGASLMEMALGRWASDKKMLAITHVTGVENVARTLAEGYGVILLCAHFTTLEASGRAFSLQSPPFDAVFRRFRSPFTTEILAGTREKSVRRLIDKNDIKRMVRSLRDGVPVWYAPDQSYHLKQSALIPFFGVPAMTNTATTTLAKLGHAKIIPFLPRRLPQGGYELRILPPIEGVPSDDPIEDTKEIMGIIEEHIRRCPEQYYWVHRKFKNRPESLPDVYADLDALK